MTNESFTLVVESMNFNRNEVKEQVKKAIQERGDSEDWGYLDIVGEDWEVIRVEDQND